MYDEWIRRLKNRYNDDSSDKNKRAYDYVSNNFFSAVESMMYDNIQWKLILDKDSHINDLNREIGAFCVENGL
jgi:hypothetical protein